MQGSAYGGPGTRAAVTLIGVGLAVTASPWARRRFLTWGATAEEAGGTLPGDDLLPDAGLVSTRAITIGAAPSVVWPWLVQMGSGRGGAYTYDWIENLFGLDMHSADEILPQFQHLVVGDTLPLGSGGPAMRVEIAEPERTLVFRSADGAWVWIFELRAAGSTTRLISRNRICLPGASRVKSLLYDIVMAPGSLIMERKMLHGIKARAERINGSAEPATREPACRH
ncbi:SRPBCC family protein [Actinoplanes oblitus]|uniref:SRPBCC family protein n=1 Tax=Actinoplanes oblitus TaxID=3040509 RepID=A0ABY8WT11_9ACTN|nr:SRPBCC family protein [Actinoplanes oblitus]WIN00127.1 SRPBCC family protein [Actinoplanes oblitus]